MKILGIETSCDETAAAILEGKNNKLKVLSNVISSQINIHKQWGGVVPEVAAREHVLHILPVIDKAFSKAKIKKDDLKAIAIANGPGLITSLIVGIETAKTLSYAWQKPIIGINHIEGHIYANFIGNDSILEKSKNIFPSLILTVSGGHNMLILMKDYNKYKIIGETRDDAAGEALDKAAQLLGLGYPGGPIISKMAKKFKEKSTINLPRPMINSKNFDFSFSGLKTALLYEIQKDKNYQNRIPEYCYEFQQAIIDVLIHKTIKAGKKYKVKSIMLAGGVSANLKLREQMASAIANNLPKIIFNIPNLKYTTDNAAMIASAGYWKAKDKKFTDWQKIKINCNSKF